MKEVLKKHEFYVALLQIIAKSGNIYNLTDGCNWGKVLLGIEILKKQGFIKTTRGVLHVTPQGKHYMEIINKKLRRKGLYKYVSCKYSCMAERMSFEDLYIPNKKI